MPPTKKRLATPTEERRMREAIFPNEATDQEKADLHNDIMTGRINNVWGSNSNLGESVTCPSGQTCMARKMNTEVLLATGLLEQFESLSSLVMAGPIARAESKLSGHRKPAEQEAADAEAAAAMAVMKDPSLLNTIIDVADRALPHIVVEPVVRLHYVEVAGKRKMLSDADKARIRKTEGEGIIFTDQIDFLDKMHLFEWAAGGLSTSMAGFRGESDDVVDAVGTKPSVPRPTKRTGGRKR